jgi:alpha-L-fucosidase
MKPSHLLTTLAASLVLPLSAAEQSMDEMWGDKTAKQGVETSQRAALFRDGNYGMFIHWGLYSNLGGQWKDKTFYGIGEWIKNQMRIPRDEYMGLAREFNPSEFDAKAIVRVAKEAGMKWIIITSKHHEGFAMFKSKHPFNIVDATPFARDPMKELADACRAAGLGFGFYYSHFQDWTAPGGAGGPDKNDDGSPASFAQYFKEKCYPQVDEICSNYGELSYVWFDTPGSMPVEDVKALAELVGRKQPNAMLCSRIGHGMGDYLSLGDMEVPLVNHDGLWETCDTTNDSWSYAWYDTNWKEPKEILHRLVSTVGRGGTYLLNVGPDGKGRIPAKAAEYLIEAGKWVKQHPQVVYGASPSPWGHAQPWGDVTRNGNTLNAVVFDWPADRRISLPGIDGNPASATLIAADGSKKPVAVRKAGAWTVLDASAVADAATTSAIASVIEVKFNNPPKIDKTLGLHPNATSQLSCELGTATNADKSRINWMEKFGEWKFAIQVTNWKPGGVVEWDVDVARAGDYHVELTYKGQGRPVWSVSTSEGAKIQNQQAASHVYHTFPTGVIRFDKPGKHKVSVSLVEGDPGKSSLEAIRFKPIH